MSGIVLSAAVRQNLSSLQDTASLLATTQQALSTGNKVNSALDNPTNFFTSASLNARASDINNLLDSIGNGVQVLQAANTGITSLSTLVSSAQSIANQALQTTAGYSTKSNVSATITGATSDDLRGTTTYTSTSALGNVLYTGASGGVTAATSAATLGGTAGSMTSSSAVMDNSATSVAITAATTLFGTTGALTTQANSTFTDGSTLTVNGKTITFRAAALPAASTLGTSSSIVGNDVTDGSGNTTVYMGTTATSTATVGDVMKAIDIASGSQYVSAINATTKVATLAGTASAITAGSITLDSSTGADLSITGTSDMLAAFKLTASAGSGQTTVTAQRSTSSTSLGSLIQDGSTLTVDGKTITFKNQNASDVNAIPSGWGKPSSGNYVTDGNGNSTVFLQGGTVADLEHAIDLATGTSAATIAGTVATVTTPSGNQASTVSSGALKLSTGTAADLTIAGSGNALGALGLNGSTGTDTSFNAARTSAAGNVSGKTLTFTSFESGTAVNVTFGDGTNGTVKTLDQLNAQLANNNMVAAIDNSTGKLTISTSNDYASHTLGSSDGGTIGGTLTSALTFSQAAAPVADTAAQNTRASLVNQFNQIMNQIQTTSQDSSFNGVNLLNGDTLKLVFDETGKSTISIQGVTYNPQGLGLSSLTSGTDFIDNNATNAILTKLNTAATTLRSQASAFGSNLSVVQARQDFSKSLINVLQTGASNLTLADANEEAANSQALTTRQSIAVQALSLANQSQQSVLQLLR